MPRTPEKILDLEIYTRSGKLRKRKRKQKRNYFTEDTENAIIKYITSTDQVQRNKLFNENINFSFHKLAENIIHTFKFYYTELDNVEELKHEVVAFLLQKIHLYDNKKGKAYSYFGTIAKRYLIVYNEENYKKKKNRATLEEVDQDKTILSNIMLEENKSEISDFLEMFIKKFENSIDKMFDKDLERKIAYSILDLFKTRENLDVLNKQAFYLYVKIATDSTAPQITKVVKQVKSLYIQLMNEYYLTGDVNTD